MNYILIEPDAISKGKVILTHPEQLAHLHRVLRVSPDDCVRVALLGGKLGQARVHEVTEQAITLTDIALTHMPPAKLPITLVVALPRPKALRRLVLDAVAMGMECIYLIHSYRVEKSYWQSPVLQQLDDYVRQGLEQSGDSIAPMIYLKKRFKPFVEDELPLIIKHRQAIVAHPKTSQQMTDIKLRANQPMVLIMGAEGGFIPYEVDLLAAQGCDVVSMGRRILRTENAMAVLVGMLNGL